MKVIKYVGAFGSVRVEGLHFKAGVPTVVPQDRVAKELLAMADFTESSLDELEAHLNPTPAPATPKEKK